jgi:hypothetical protein
VSDRKITAMHGIYGKRHYGKCGECRHFIRKHWSKLYRKCGAYGDTNCAATDWNVSYDACRLYDQDLPYGHRPVIERLKRSGRGAENEPMEGQLSL